MLITLIEFEIAKSNESRCRKIYRELKIQNKKKTGSNAIGFFCHRKLWISIQKSSSCCSKWWINYCNCVINTTFTIQFMSHMSYFNGTGNLINKPTNKLGAFPPSRSLAHSLLNLELFWINIDFYALPSRHSIWSTQSNITFKHWQLNTNTLIILIDREKVLTLSFTHSACNLQVENMFFFLKSMINKVHQYLMPSKHQQNWMEYWYFYGFNSAPLPLATICWFTIV